MSATTITLAANTWTMLNSADATVVALQNQSGYDLRIMGTTGTSAPTTTDGCRVVRPYEGLTAADTFDAIWPAQSFKRMWALCIAATSVAVAY